MRPGVIGIACWLLVASGLAAPAVASCVVQSSSLNFGRVNLREGDEITGEVIVECTSAASFDLSLTAGSGSRHMRGPDGAELEYTLYVDLGRTRVWGDGVSGNTFRLRGQSDGSGAVHLPFYGKVPRGQSVHAGAYSDSLMIIVETR